MRLPISPLVNSNLDCVLHGFVGRFIGEKLPLGHTRLSRDATALGDDPLLIIFSS